MLKTWGLLSSLGPLERDNSPQVEPPTAWERSSGLGTGLEANPHAMGGASSQPEIGLAEVMRRDVISLEAGDSVASALRLMRLVRVRVLPVVDEGVLVGVLAARDLLYLALRRVLEDEGPCLETTPIREVMDQAAAVLDLDATLPRAARLLCEQRRGCVPVVDAAGRGRLVGLVTETDLLRRAYRA